MSNVLDVIGENFNTSRRIKATSPRVVKDGDSVKLSYVNLKGETDFLDVTSIYPEDPAQVKKNSVNACCPGYAHEEYGLYRMGYFEAD